MYWLQPPPYLRRAAAAALLLAAFVWDLRGTANTPHPFAARPLPAGSPIAAGDVDWRHLPRGAFPVPSLEGMTAAVDLAPGDPLTAPVLTEPMEVPEGWWAVPVDIRSPATPGSSVLLVVLDPPLTVPGVVVTPQRGDRFGMDYSPAMVAVPAEAAPLVAAAERAGFLVTATRP